jgi:hypothetical protein
MRNGGLRFRLAHAGFLPAPDLAPLIRLRLFRQSARGSLSFQLVGWVERSETHRGNCDCDGLRKGSTHPTSLIRPRYRSREFSPRLH